MGYFMPSLLKCVQFLGDILGVSILKCQHDIEFIRVSRMGQRIVSVTHRGYAHSIHDATAKGLADKGG